MSQVFSFHLHCRVFGNVHPLDQLVLSAQRETPCDMLMLIQMKSCRKLAENESFQDINNTDKMCKTTQDNSLTIGVSKLHIASFPSKDGDVTLTLRTVSGEGKADGKGDRESGVRDWGDSRVGAGEGERGSKLRLCVESVLLWPLVR